MIMSMGSDGVLLALGYAVGLQVLTRPSSSCRFPFVPSPPSLFIIANSSIIYDYFIYFCMIM